MANIVNLNFSGVFDEPDFFTGLLDNGIDKDFVSCHEGQPLEEIIYEYYCETLNEDFQLNIKFTYNEESASKAEEAYSTWASDQKVRLTFQDFELK
jgi:hypothetical protein